MPITEQVRVNSHTGNGVTTVFAYGFKIFADEDLTVTVDGIVKTLTTDYTVTGAGSSGGGTVIFVTAPINLSAVTVSGELPYDRSTDYVDNGAMLAQTVDDDFDKGVMLVQQLRRDVKRSIKIPIEETTDQEVSLTAANRANKVLAFDASGLPVAQSLTDLSSVFSTVDTSLALSGAQLSVAIPNRQAVAAGTVDAITAVFSPVITVLTNNLAVIIETTGANATTTPNFAPDGLTAKTIVKGSGTALEPGDIPGANYRAHLVFDATLDSWVLLNPVTVPISTTVTLTGTQTLTNKTMASPVLTTPRIASGGYIADENGNELLAVLKSTTPVNHLQVSSADATSGPAITAIGSDTNIDVKIIPKGTGGVHIDGAMAPVTWPSISVSLGSNQVISGTGAFVKINFDTEEWDTNSDYDNATNYRFTPTQAGKYTVHASLEFTAAVNGDFWLAVYKNGIEYKRTPRGESTLLGIPVSCLVDMNGTTDYIEIHLFNNVAVTCSGFASHCWFQASRIA